MGLDEGGTLFRLNALQREPIDPTIASSHSISEGKDCPIESLGSTLEERMDDVRAIMDDVGSRQAVLLGFLKARR
jgi:hypothetical protein